MQTSIAAVARRAAVQSLRLPLRLSSTTARSFSSLPSLRPTLGAHTSAIIRPPTTLPAFSPATNVVHSASGAEARAAADLVPQSAISTHPAFGGQQIRCGPRNTMQRHTRLIQKRRHSFLTRTRTRGGRAVLARRRTKGRKKLGW